MHGVGLLLLSAVAGYWVLERSSVHKGELKRVGQLLGGLVIVVSLIGVVCTVACMAGGMGCGSMGMGKGMKGTSCPFTSKMAPAASR